MKSININDLKKKARRYLPNMVFDYLEGGAQDERSLKENCLAYQQWRFVPRRLRQLQTIQTQTTIFGEPLAFPALIAPTGLNSLFWPEGDLALARAANTSHIPFTLSTASSVSLERVAKHAKSPLWFQLYVVENNLALSLVDRARNADYDALVVTVDVVANGKRERDIRNGFGLPLRHTFRTLLDGLRHPAWTYRYLRHGLPVLGNFDHPDAQTPEARSALLSRSMDPQFDWDALARLRERWPKRMLVKGLLHADDISRCKALGIDGVVLSNHGGRQLDDMCSPLDVLAQLPPQDNFIVLLDGGIRRGSDIAKAVALGADAVLIGRAVLYGLASAGQKGAEHALALLKGEYRDTLMQLGCPSSSALQRDYLRPANLPINTEPANSLLETT